MVEQELGIDILWVQSHTSYNKITVCLSTFPAVIVTCNITQSDSETAFILGIVRGIITEYNQSSWNIFSCDYILFGSPNKDHVAL